MKNILERVTILPKDNDEIEAKIRAKLDSLSKEKQQLNFDPIIRWYRNDVKNNIQQNVLTLRYINGLNNIIDEIIEYYDSLEKHPNIANEKILINNREIAANNLAEIRRYENAMHFLSKVRILANRRIAQKTPKEYELATDDMLAIELIGESEHVMAWETRGYETTNKFVFNLWQNPNMNVTYGNKEINSPYCTRMKGHWDSYSTDTFEDEYRQVWFLIKLDGDFKYDKGTLNNPNVKKIFDAMKGFGPSLILAMDDSGLDLLNDKDLPYNMDDDKEEEFKEELLKLDVEIFKDAIEYAKDEYNPDGNFYDDDDEEDDDDGYIDFKDVADRRYPILKNNIVDLEFDTYFPKGIDIDFNDVPVDKDGSYNLIKYIIKLINDNNTDNEKIDLNSNETIYKIIKQHQITVKSISIPNNLTQFKIAQKLNNIEVKDVLSFYRIKLDISNLPNLVYISSQTVRYFSEIIFRDFQQVLNCNFINDLQDLHRYSLACYAKLINKDDELVISNDKQAKQLVNLYNVIYFTSDSNIFNKVVIKNTINIPEGMLNVFHNCIRTLTIFGKQTPTIRNILTNRVTERLQTLNVEYASVLSIFKENKNQQSNKTYGIIQHLNINIYNVDDDSILQTRLIQTCRELDIYKNGKHVDDEILEIKTTQTKPDEYNHIASEYYFGSNNLKKIRIKEPINFINSFGSCKNLEYVELPSTITTIGIGSFEDCAKLKTVVFKPTNNTVTFCYHCFKKSGLENLDLTPYASVKFSSNNIRGDNSAQFAQCKQLKTVILPKIADGILQDYMFYFCQNLESADLTQTNCTEIRQNCFDTTNLKIVKFPNTLEIISPGAFGSGKFEEIDLSNTKVNRIDRGAFYGCDKLKTIKLPNTLTFIGGACFANCKSLVEIDLSNTKIDTIDYDAFRACNSLKNIKLPNTLTAIGHDCFEECTSLETIDLSNTAIKEIPYGLFIRCISLKTIFLPKTIKENISSYAFYNCKNLEKIYIPKEIKHIKIDDRSGKFNDSVQIEYI